MEDAGNRRTGVSFGVDFYGLAKDGLFLNKTESEKNAKHNIEKEG